MKSTLFVLVFSIALVLLVRSSSASMGTWIGLEKVNRTNVKRYEKHCLGTLYGLGSMEEGEVKRIPFACALATCMENRDIRFSGCPVVALSDQSCRVYVGDLSLDYPDCCYQIRCNETIKTNEGYGGYVNMTAIDLKRKAKEAEEESNS